MSEAAGWRRRYGIELPAGWSLVSALALVAVGSWRETILVALPEELIFRGVVQGEIAARDPRPWVAPIVSSLLFAAAHVVAGQGSVGLLTFFPGLLLAGLRRLSGSLLPPVALHALLNLLWLGRG